MPHIILYNMYMLSTLCFSYQVTVPPGVAVTLLVPEGDWVC